MALAAALRTRLSDRGGPAPSYAELAKAAGVSLATLRHYFGSRDEAVAAVLDLHGALGEPHLAALREPGETFDKSIRQAVAHVAEGLDQPLVAELHAVGVAEGLSHPTAGPAYLDAVLEPTILALEARLAEHITRGDMRDVDPREAALFLISPLLVAHLHQRWLGGSQGRPLDAPAHRTALVDAFVRAYRR